MRAHLITAAAAMSVCVACWQVVDETAQNGVDTSVAPSDDSSTRDVAPFEAPGSDSCRMATCPWLSEDAGGSRLDTDGVGPAQSWCSPDASNAPSCPPDAPTPGAACASPGLQCGYRASSRTFSLVTCDAKASTWTSIAHVCSDTCDGDEGGVFPIDAPCEAGPPITCFADFSVTDQEDLDFSFLFIAQCCGVLSENGVTVHLDHGCPTSISVHRPVDYAPCFVECLSRLIAGRRFSCAKDVACGSASWSTRK